MGYLGKARGASEKEQFYTNRANRIPPPSQFLESKRKAANCVVHSTAPYKKLCGFTTHGFSTRTSKLQELFTYTVLAKKIPMKQIYIAFNTFKEYIMKSVATVSRTPHEG